MELVVFDMAGTTVYDGDAVNDCLRAALAAAGTMVTRDEINGVMGNAKPIAIRTLLVEKAADAGSVTDAIVERTHADFLARMVLHYRTSPEVREADGASDTFRRLRAAGIRVALDTGFSRDIADVILARLGWAHGGIIDTSVTSDEVARGRPHPDLIYRAMELTGVREARNVAKVGDTPADLRQGAAAGCGLVVGVTSGSHTREELLGEPHTHLIDRLEELVPLALGAV
jgi:phosphonatase-like hydrolase